MTNALAVGVAAAVLALAPLSAAAQPARVITVDMSSIAGRAPAELFVDGNRRVVVHVVKSTFQACTVDSKVEALPPPPNPIAQILAILNPLVGGSAPSPAASNPAGRPSGGEGLARQLERLKADAAALIGDLDGQLAEVRQAAASLPERVACRNTAAENPCTDPAVARARLATLAEDLQRTPPAPIGSVALVSSRAAELSKLLVGRMAEIDPGGDEWLQAAFGQLRAAQELIDAAIDRRQSLIKARDALLVIRERVLGFAPDTAVDVPLTPIQSSKTTVTVSCVNIVTQQPMIYDLTSADQMDPVAQRVAPLSTVVISREVPWATVSGGVLYSLVDRRQIGIRAVSSGADGTGGPAFERRIGETDAASGQPVPFSFFNITLPGLRSHRAYAAASLGVGLNANNGPKVVEYFLGGAVGLGRSIVLDVGVHFGTRLEPGGGFAVDDILPDRLSAVPTERARVTGLAFGLSYGLPLPK